MSAAHSHLLSGRGVLLSVTASCVFAALGWYTVLLTPLAGIDIYAWRVVWTVPAMLLVLALLRHGPRLRTMLGRLRHEKRLWLALPVCALLLAIQQWLFMWAPLEGRLLEVSLGYFLLPLVMVLVGRVFYHERLSRLQWLAVAFALAGVLHELWLTRAFSWVTLLTALGYPPYLMLRRHVQLEAVSGFLLETLLILPWAAWHLASHPLATSALTLKPMLWLLLPGLGALTAWAFASYLAASRLLPMSLLGILGYVEPALLFIISVAFLHEPFSASGLGTYVPIWIAIVLTCSQSALQLRRQLRS
ncbi:chloramphenicol-sensitive protein RarD [Andreprevotia lacus DSM 23236]|jgi:chloramphenicol-sensitive protein RarD|uniref:Chloramphenicol-sensitive protein RarD n=1 Tax=Andreprevotia lacus DSM 23236 TaxID=1121001 RepID=A0A1W1X6S5_9NEIS|nr:EamA family transporter RarD [Andreprevotia lacus]SMC19544.1 chloramphenicol-sensitive protein RarD [Andreprevotia lacus DSM 23236]